MSGREEICPDGCPPCRSCGVHVDPYWWEKRNGYCSYCALNYTGAKA